MPAIQYDELRNAIQYTGSNSAEMESLISQFDFVSEGGGTLNFTSNGTPFSVSTGDWVLYTQGAVQATFTNSQFTYFYVQQVTSGELSALSATVSSLSATLATLSGVAVRSVGVASAPTLLLGVPANVAVTLVPAMPNTSYTASAYIFGTGVNLSQVTVNSVTVTSASVVTVNVSTGLASLPGVHVLVVVRS